eukprot:8125303-Alexandrium_andersonii.AAC.1
MTSGRWSNTRLDHVIIGLSEGAVGESRSREDRGHIFRTPSADINACFNLFEAATGCLSHLEAAAKFPA